MVFLGRIQDSKQQQHLEGMRRDHWDEDSRTLGWFLLGPRDRSLPPLGAALKSKWIRERKYPGSEQSPNLRTQGNRISGAERWGSP